MLLLLQAFIPAAAIAHDHAPSWRGVEVCTPSGFKRIRIPVRHHRGFGGLACEQCVIASLTALGAAAPPPIPAVVKVEAVEQIAVARLSVTRRSYLRPPSRAPPAAC